MPVYPACTVLHLFVETCIFVSDFLLAAFFGPALLRSSWAHSRSSLSFSSSSLFSSAAFLAIADSSRIIVSMFIFGKFLEKEKKIIDWKKKVNDILVQYFALLSLEEEVAEEGTLEALLSLEEFEEEVFLPGFSSSPSSSSSAPKLDAAMSLLLWKGSKSEKKINITTY